MPPNIAFDVSVVVAPLQRIDPDVILAEMLIPAQTEIGGMIAQSNVISVLVFVQPKESVTVMV